MIIHHKAGLENIDGQHKENELYQKYKLFGLDGDDKAYIPESIVDDIHECGELQYDEIGFAA